jgi:hypothetical protein
LEGAKEPVGVSHIESTAARFFDGDAKVFNLDEHLVKVVPPAHIGGDNHGPERLRKGNRLKFFLMFADGRLVGGKAAIVAP